MAESFQIDEKLAEQFRAYQKAQRARRLNTIFGTGAAAAGAVAGYDPMAFLRLIGEPVLGDSPDVKRVSAEAINDLLELKRAPAKLDKENNAKRLEAEIDLKLDLVKRATELTTAQMAGNTEASSKIAELGAGLSKPLLEAKTKLLEATRQAPTEAMVELINAVPEASGDLDRIALEITTRLPSILAAAGGTQTDMVKLGAQLNGMFTNLGTDFPTVMAFLRDKPDYQNIVAQLTPHYDSWKSAATVLSAEIENDANRAFAALSAGPGSAGAIFKRVYAELYNSVYNTDPPGAESTEAKSDEATVSDPSTAELADLPGDDDIDRMLAYHEKNLTAPEPAPATQYLRQQIVSNPNFAAMKAKLGFTSDDQAIKALMGAVRASTRQEKALARDFKKGVKQTGVTVVPAAPKQPVAPENPGVAGAPAVPAVGSPPAATGAVSPPKPRVSVFQTPGDSSKYYYSDGSGTVIPYDIATGKPLTPVAEDAEEIRERKLIDRTKALLLADVAKQ